MLERDKYTQDETLKYHPDFTMLSFVNTYSGLNPTIAPYLPEQVASIRSNSAISVYGSSSLFLLGVAGAVFYKRLPWIKRFTSKKARFLWSAFFILIPSGVFSAFWNAYTASDVEMKFAKNSQNFAMFKASGDITKLNPNVRMVED